jgi:hypothetical protein
MQHHQEDAMAIMPYKGSKADGIAYRGTETFTCPHCQETQTTVSMELRLYDPSAGHELETVDESVYSIILLEESLIRFEIVCNCKKCRLLVKFTRQIAE